MPRPGYIHACITTHLTYDKRVTSVTHHQLFKLVYYVIVNLRDRTWCLSRSSCIQFFFCRCWVVLSMRLTSVSSLYMKEGRSVNVRLGSALKPFVTKWQLCL